MRYLIFILIFIFSLSVFATSKSELVKITNDTDELVAYIYVLVDNSNDITGFEYSKFRNGEVIDTKIIPGNITTEGIVLETARNKNVVILKALNFSPINGGDLEIDFLFNGISGARGRYGLELIQNQEQWVLKKEGALISHLHLVANIRPGYGVIGIRKILIKN